MTLTAYPQKKFIFHGVHKQTGFKDSLAFMDERLPGAIETCRRLYPDFKYNRITEEN